MKRFLPGAIVALAAMNAAALEFDASKGVRGETVLPCGRSVAWTGYEGLRYVDNVEDETYQTMNVYVPDVAASGETPLPPAPIFLRTYVGGYMAAAAARPQAGDATGRALAEGFVVAIPGARGRNCVQDGVHTGRAPAAILDLKAAVRYLRHFAKDIPADAERIVTDGTSAGGAMSALLGATGNAPEYEPLLEAMGAAKERDDVFAAVCFCPITDLRHADMAYEWLYGRTASRRAQGEAASSRLNEIQKVSAELAAQYPAYLDSLGLGVNSTNCLDLIRREIIRAAQIAKNAGADIPGGIGFTFSEAPHFGAPPVNGTGGSGVPPLARPKRRDAASPCGEYITDLDMAAYLDYVVSTQPLKTAPAFDTLGVAGQAGSGENDEFGDKTGTGVNFTNYSSAKNGKGLDAGTVQNERLLNPMDFIGKGNSSVAPHWYIRHGARDRDTAFTVPLCLALALEKDGKDVNFLLAWNRPHSGDYSLDELFAWLRCVAACNKETRLPAACNKETRLPAACNKD